MDEVKSFMGRQICPACKYATVLHGKPTHSAMKQKICEKLIREKFNVVKAQKIVLEDGKELEMRAQVMTKEEAQKGFREGRVIQ